MSEKDDNDLMDFPKIDFEKKSFRKIRLCQRCERIVTVLEQLTPFQGKWQVSGICPWCKKCVYKREKEDGDEWLALSN